MKKFAIIGLAGYIAPRHIAAINDTGNQLVIAYDKSDSVGVIDSISPNSDFFLEFETFYEKALEFQKNDKDRIEYVTVCSPNYLHFAHVALSLRLGCNVICEKPLVPTLRDLNKLKIIEKETGKKVYTILQLRHHKAVQDLRNKVLSSYKDKRFRVDLKYITSRGPWYLKSWKGDPKKSFGVITNIGIHFFDMLHYIFGDLKEMSLLTNSDSKAKGKLIYERADVEWFLSIDKNDLPDKKKLNNSSKTFRSINIDGEELEFSDGFTDLHTKSYQEILKGNGFGLDTVSHSVALVEKLRKKSI